MKRSNKTSKNKASQPELFEINIADLHLGKLAWSNETDNADYDTSKAAEVTAEAIVNSPVRQPNQPAHRLPWGEEALGL